MHEVWVTAITEPIDLPEFSFSPKGRFIGIASSKTWGAQRAEGPIATFAQPVRAENTPGKADPIWDTAFQPKLGRNPQGELKKPVQDKFVVPKGHVEAFDRYLERAGQLTPQQEWEWIDSTCHSDIATTIDEFRANGIASVALDTENDEEPTPITEGDKVDGIVYTPSAQHIAAMSRRIFWERYRTCNDNNVAGYKERVFWSVTKDNTIGVEYQGPERNAMRILDKKREFKYRWIAQFGDMPSLDEIKAIPQTLFDTHGKPAMARLTESQKRELQTSLKFGTEDPDPYRLGFHAVDDPKPVFADYDDDEIDAYVEEVEAWTKRESLRAAANNRPDGYAGPSGMLGLDEDPID